MRTPNDAPSRPWRWVAPAAIVASLVLWEWLVRVGRVPALFFPAPSTIADALIRMIFRGSLLADLWITLSRVCAGLALGASAGFLLGLLTGRSRILRTLLEPSLAALHPLPKIALLPLILIIFGLGEPSKIVAIAVSSFFPMWINTLAGVLQIHPVHFEVAQNYGASTRKLFTHVIVPASLPWVLTGLRLALNTALLIAISVELAVARQGLGQLIWFAWETLRTDELYATLVVIALLGLFTNQLLEWMVRRLVPWQQLDEGQ